MDKNNAEECIVFLGKIDVVEGKICVWTMDGWVILSEIHQYLKR